MKQIIRLTESDLHRIVKESVQKILREGVMDDASFDSTLVDKILNDISPDGSPVNVRDYNVAGIMARYGVDERVARAVKQRLINNSLFDTPMREF